MNLLDVYDEERICEYRGEVYSVRDNGAVMRHARDGEKTRKLDNSWTFGIVDKQHGYMRFSSEAVHRIVATAFHGPAPSEQHIVDHQDTNRQNNRPENLRWVTKIENILINEITCKKLEMSCGCSIEQILADISILQNKRLSTDIAWMKTVSQEEAAESLKSWKQWARDAAEQKTVRMREGRREREEKRSFLPRHNYGNSPSAMQYPLEPKAAEASLEDYYNELKLKHTLAYKNHYGEISSYRITDFYLNRETNVLTVATELEDGLKKYYLTYITIEDNHFSYEARSFFSPEGQKKYMTIARGEKWTGGEVIDDYC